MEDFTEATRRRDSMRYALLVCNEENAELSEEDVERQYAEFMGFQDEMQARGVLVSRAARNPGARYGTIEVRPVWEI
jgi:hypothetical protein